MEQAEMIGLLVIGAGALLAITTPILKLNSTITKLNTNFENMTAQDRKRDERLDRHSRKITNLQVDVGHISRDMKEHEKRIDGLEKKKG